MNQKILFISVIIMLLLVQGASAVPSTTGTNGTTVLVNGKPTFIVGTVGICVVGGTQIENCQSSINNNTNTSFDLSSLKFRGAFISNGYQQLYKSNNVFTTYPFGWAAKGQWTPGMEWFNNLQDPSKGVDNVSIANQSNFFGYHMDEPEGSNDVVTRDQLIVLYNQMHAIDPNHVVLTILCCYGGPNTSSIHGLTAYKNTADVFSWDTYPYSTRFCCWNLNDSLYGWEHVAESAVLDTHSSGLVDLDAFGKPVLTVIQANALDEMGTNKVIPDNMIRANTYMAIAMGVDGLWFWQYNIDIIGYRTGLVVNKTKNTYVQQLAGELKSLEHVFLLPRLAYSWQYDLDFNSITFSNNPSKIVSKAGNPLPNARYALNYRLIKNTTTNKYYLIVVNKDPNPVSTTISIQALNGSGTMTATTIGLVGTGAGAPGRTITFTGGTSTLETYEGYASVIYEIGSRKSAPIITDYRNTKSNNNNISINLNASEEVTFNFTTNQNVTGMWTNTDGSTMGNVTTSYKISWVSNGSKIVTGRGTNNNGTTGTITWNIQVSLKESNPSKIGVGGVAWDLAGTSSNVYIEDSKIKLGFWGENFDDGSYDWSSEYGNISIVNGKLSMYGNTNAQVSKIIGNHSDIAMFATWTETNVDGFKGFSIRSNNELSSPDMNYWVSMRPDGLGIFIVKWNGTAWVNVNGTGIFTRTAGQTSYCIEKGYVSTFKVYCSHTSYADALFSAPVSQGTDTSYAYGNKIQLEGEFNLSRGTDKVTFDNLRLIPLDVSGNLINSGSKTVHYDAGADNETNSVIINATTPSNTNYTISYRQKNMGSWIPMGGAYTGNQTISISGTKYRDTEINITLFGNGTSFPDIETIEFIREQSTPMNINPRYDVDDDGTVDMEDLKFVNQNFNRIVSIPYPRYDVNMDGLVNIFDAVIVSQHFE